MSVTMKLNDKHLAAFVNSSSPIDQEGYLLKRGEVNKAFQKRWFVLKGNLLFYFEKRGDREPIGVIILEGCTVELSESSDAFAFQISFEGTGSRAYMLACESQESMEKWMKAVTCAGYDYMKLMVGELQRQLDELSATEQIRLAHVPVQSKRDSELLRNTGKESDVNLLDLSERDSKLPQAEVLPRVNPFNKSRESDPLESFNTNLFSAEDSFGSDLVRGFEKMHDDFGKSIQHKIRDYCK